MIYDELKESGSHWFKAVSTNTGDIAAFIKWQEPKPGVFSVIDLPTWPEGADERLCNETFGDWARKKQEVMEDRGHWCMINSNS